MSDVLYTYDESKAPIVGYVSGVPQRGVLDGVPMRDLTQADFDRLPERLKKAVTSVPYFVPVVGVAAPEPLAEEPKKKGK